MPKQKDTANEHFVPECYLKAWTLPKTEKVYALDVKTEKVFTPNIRNIASQRYFYDIEPAFLLPIETIQKIQKGELALNPMADQKTIEYLFANKIETVYSQYLNKIIQDAQKATPWHIKNCFFLRPEEKEIFAQLLTLQFVRTRQLRKELHESRICLISALKDMEIPEEYIHILDPDKQDIKIQHLRLLSDLPFLIRITEKFLNLTWLLLINRTDQKFYTSDNPVITSAHVLSEAFNYQPGGSGILSIFPISPDFLLVMYDASSIGVNAPHTISDMYYMVCSDPNEIDNYNQFIAAHADQIIISHQNCWAPYRKVLIREPNIFEHSRIKLTLHGKTYIADDQMPSSTVEHTRT